MGDVAFALMLSTLAGLSTTVGSVLGISVRKPGPRFMALTLGFSAGVMLHVSFVELLGEGIESVGFLPAHAAFFVGMLLMFAVDALVPHNYLGQEEHKGLGMSSSSLMKAGVFTAIGIAIHNFPEGMATFVAALQDRSLGVALAVAIAIHNIPEGLAVAAPIYAATGSRRKAFLYSFLSGVAEPVGAGLAALILLPVLTETVLGLVLAAVAGVMVFISLDELIPVARSFGHGHLAIAGTLVGMAIMALSLWLL